MKSDRTACHELGDLLRQARRALDVHLCYHDRLGETKGLDRGWRIHTAPCCNAIKKTHLAACVAYDVSEVQGALAGRQAGRIQTCPFGITELAVPVVHDGAFAGVLFAGPFWTGRGGSPHAGMMKPPGRSWLEDRLVLLRGVALQVAGLLSQPIRPGEESRRAMLLRFIRDRMPEAIYLSDAARRLSLSPSRARHAIGEMFGMPFSALVRSVKLTEGAYLLKTTDLQIGQIADRTGYPDQNYFTRIFTRHFKMTPRTYRRRYATAP